MYKSRRPRWAVSAEKQMMIAASGVGESSQRTRATSTSRARATPRVTRSSSVLQLVDEEESEETDEEDVDGYKSNDEGQDYDLLGVDVEDDWRSTMEAIFSLRQLMEKYRAKRKNLHMVFIDLEKAYDRGVPLRIEIGPRDVANGTVVICRRDVPGKQGKTVGVSTEPSILEAQVREHLDDIQTALLQKATLFSGQVYLLNILDVTSYDELKTAISQGKWARGPWSASDADELKVKEETGATIRCFPFEQPFGLKTCLMTGNPANEVAIFAKSY
ncbi:proline--tRNA ligase, chloroplastic/mitochondrial-like protein [Cinnamomum micranthum f. kanehirae]|uniref:Proline--tRNA ligase, chloroplastic/mitochondrial-like protein n=1 Tax=Cinnamomum micranthum f. kanehirae TaxID=337451 RepID=A0A3S3MH46_9MAGN|nr:proline--tRNA ligase, chloroplastic/mitochondrial-like protein [Cinnamomum micranthum f. kanehirae]